MRLPNGDRAFIPEGKLAAYCLNPEHAEGKFKAMAFRSALGLTAADESELRRELLHRALTGEVASERGNPLGVLYVIDFAMTRGSRSARIRSVWFVPKGTDAPRLVTCFVDG